MNCGRAWLTAYPFPRQSTLYSLMWRGDVMIVFVTGLTCSVLHVQWTVQTKNKRQAICSQKNSCKSLTICFCGCDSCDVSAHSSSWVFCYVCLYNLLSAISSPTGLYSLAFWSLVVTIHTTCCNTIVYMCSVWCSKRRAVIALNSINWLVILMVKTMWAAIAQSV